MTIVQKLDGYKTYLAAAGLFGLALYQVSVAQYQDAVQTLLAALAAAGLRNALGRTGSTATRVSPEPRKAG